MPTEKSRRRKNPTRYDILLVPDGEGGKTRRFRTGKGKLILLVVLSIVSIVGVTLALLMYTPLALYIPISSPELEKKYGQLAAETQDKLQILTKDVILLKDYNQQLRKALGEPTGGDSASSLKAPIYFTDESSERTDPPQEGLGLNPVAGKGDEELSLGAYSFVDAYAEGGGLRVAFPLLPPSEGFVTQGFDPTRRHYGIDFATRRGTPVYAATDGYVVFAGWTYEDGNMIILSHGGGYLTVYKHNQSLAEGVHEYVKRGELIALSGSSGKTSSGPHVHFEVWKDGVPQNPNDYLLNPTTIQ